MINVHGFGSKNCYIQADILEDEESVWIFRIDAVLSIDSPKSGSPCFVTLANGEHKTVDCTRYELIEALVSSSRPIVL